MEAAGCMRKKRLGFCLGEKPQHQGIPVHILRAIAVRAASWLRYLLKKDRLHLFLDPYLLPAFLAVPEMQLTFFCIFFRG
jgi:hypothetical protein